MLILFDIDGTLLHSHGLGRAAMEAAFHELFGVFPIHVDYAGRLDGWIWRSMCEAHDVSDTDDQERIFRDLYTRKLAALLVEGTTRPEALPGVTTLLDVLGRRDDVTLGLLTGNYPETGRLKLEGAGLAPGRFSVGAFGSDGAARADLVPVATRRLTSLTGRTVTSGQVVVVGDTPHDVDCARAHGCRSLAVETGFATREDLVASGPDHLLPDLTDTASVVRWLEGEA